MILQKFVMFLKSQALSQHSLPLWYSNNVHFSYGFDPSHNLTPLKCKTSLPVRPHTFDFVYLMQPCGLYKCSSYRMILPIVVDAMYI